MWDAAAKALSRVGVIPKAPKLTRRLPVEKAALLQHVGKSVPVRSTAEKPRVLVTSLISSSNNKRDSWDISQAITRSGGIVDDTGNGKVSAIVCDARNAKEIASLKDLYTKLQPTLPRLDKKGRLVIVSPDAAVAALSPSPSVGTAAVAQGLIGFTRAISKELAGRGVTANLISCGASSPSAHSIAGPLEYLLSPRSSYVTGQVLSIESTAGGTAQAQAQAQTQGTEQSLISLAKKRVVITGASRGIGEHTALAIAAEGAELLLVDHPSMTEQLSALTSTLSAAGIKCSSCALDVTAADSPTVLLTAIRAAFTATGEHGAGGGGDGGDGGGSGGAGGPGGLVDVMVHNAGITRDKTFKRMKQEYFNAVLDVNLDAIMRIDQMLLGKDSGTNPNNHGSPSASGATAAVMARGSRMVYLSSISGISGAFGQSNYSCSKAAIIGYVRAMSRDKTFAETVGVTGFNAIAPGFIETDMTNAMPGLMRNVGRRMNAMMQGGYPVDVAEAVLFLASDASQGINGSTLRVCGGHFVGA